MLLKDHLPFIQCFLSAPGSSTVHVVERPPSIHPVLLVFSRLILNQCCWKTTFHSSSASCLLQAHPQSMLLKDHLPFIQCFLSSPGSSSVHVVERPPSIHPVLLVFSRLILSPCCWKTTFYSSSVEDHCPPIQCEDHLPPIQCGGPLSTHPVWKTTFHSSSVEDHLPPIQCGRPPSTHPVWKTTFHPSSVEDHLPPIQCGTPPSTHPVWKTTFYPSSVEDHLPPIQCGRPPSTHPVWKTTFHSSSLGDYLPPIQYFLLLLASCFCSQIIYVQDLPAGIFHVYLCSHQIHH